MSNSQDSLTAPTLRLGDETSEPSSDDDQPDSQRPGAWQGKAYVVFNRIERAKKEEEERKAALARNEELLVEIRKSLDTALEDELQGTQSWELYQDWCRRVLERNGFDAFGTLCLAETYFAWFRRMKEDPLGVCDGLGSG